MYQDDYITGDTFARSEITGKDEYFQFIIPKGKVVSENTITLEAEGDPSVFNMSVEVLRTDTAEMIRLVKYDLDFDSVLGDLIVKSVAGETAGFTKITVAPGLTPGHGYVYKVGSTVALPELDDNLSTWDQWGGVFEIEAVNGQELVIAEVNALGEVKKAGKVIVVAD